MDLAPAGVEGFECMKSMKLLDLFHSFAIRDGSFFFLLSFMLGSGKHRIVMKASLFVLRVWLVLRLRV